MNGKGSRWPHLHRVLYPQVLPRKRKEVWEVCGALWRPCWSSYIHQQPLEGVERSLRTHLKNLSSYKRAYCRCKTRSSGMDLKGPIGRVWSLFLAPSPLLSSGWGSSQVGSAHIGAKVFPAAPGRRVPFPADPAKVLGPVLLGWL